MENLDADTTRESDDSLLNGIFGVDGITIDADRLVIHSTETEVSVEPKVMAVLLYLLEKQGKVVTREELIEHVWQTKFSGDESLTRAISILRKAFKELGQKEKVIETVPTRGYRFVLATQSSSMEQYSALDTAQEKGFSGFVDVDDERKHRSSKVTASAILVVVVGMLLIVFSASWLSGTTAKMQGLVSISEFSVDPSDAAAGMQTHDFEALTRRILVRNGVVVQGEQETDTEAEFKISGAVEVLSDGMKRITLSVSLEDDERLLHSFETTSQQLSFQKLEKDLLRPAAQTIGCVVRQTKYDEIVPPEAMQIYFSACDAIDGETIWRSNPSYRRAIFDLMPTSVTARANYAIALVFDANNNPGLRADARKEIYNRAGFLAQQAYNQDSENPAANIAIAISRPFHENWLFLEQQLLEAIAHGYGVDGVDDVYAAVLRMMGRRIDAISILERKNSAGIGGVVTDPILVWLYTRSGNPVAAAAELAKMESSGVERSLINQFKLEMLVFLDDPDDALSHIEVMRREPSRLGEGDWACLEAYANFRAGRGDTASVRNLCSQNIVNVWRMRIYAGIGDKEALLHELESLDPSLPQFAINFYFPTFAIVWREPRFWAVAAKFGLTKYWLKSGSWPDFCGTAIPAADCKNFAQVFENS